MSKYKVGDELIIVTDPNQETKKIKRFKLLKKKMEILLVYHGV